MVQEPFRNTVSNLPPGGNELGLPTPKADIIPLDHLISADKQQQ